MQSSTGQYSTQAGEPAQPVQHSVMTASSFGFFLRGVVMPLERGSCLSSMGTIPGAVFRASRSGAMVPDYIRDPRVLCSCNLQPPTFNLSSWIAQPALAVAREDALKHTPTTSLAHRVSRRDGITVPL